MEIEKAIEFFILEQELKGSTEKTVSNYKVMLGMLCGYLKKENITTLEQLKLIHLNGYHLELRKRSIKQRSIRTYLSHIRTFLNFCYREELMPESLTAKLIIPRQEKPIIEILSDEEIRLLYSSYNSKSEFGLRNICIMSLMLDCGLRESEVINLMPDDLNLNQGYLVVKNGKGNKGRIVPVGRLVSNQLGKYLYKRTNKYNCEFLLLSRNYQQMSASSVVQMFTRLKRKTGIVRVHAHLLRHTYATNFLLRKQGDIYELSRILGHADVKITEVYLHIASYYQVMAKRGERQKSTLEQIL